jgi:hypothetical protein
MRFEFHPEALEEYEELNPPRAGGLVEITVPNVADGSKKPRGL